jgi:hypothetical protein
MTTELGGLILYNLTLPDAAGGHQQRKETASLVRELGDNYERYHSFLAKKLSAHGGRPDPSAYRDDMPGYLRACVEVRDVVVAEMLLRRCRAYRKLGRSLHDPLDTTIPLFDGEHRLISTELGRPIGEARSSAAAVNWKPPPPPDRLLVPAIRETSS